ncbi:hypothetical protein So717_38320 [Roseobacter cerasinus]|uniref:PEP-CTERM protein-sorting domain-containing protein n=2 Tax=Roseobacter cerasinus TaxID=2602289 RepID=A0A640VVM6_9RHOB|nr:hypothetical protein So717_38320 [Roseobacter cerasinus]
MRTFFVCGAAAVCLAMQPVQAAVVDGMVTGGDGSFEQIVNTTGLMVGENNQQIDRLFAFNEKQSITLGADLVTDIGGTIAAGTTISSHYVFFDPASESFQDGYVDFDSNILGIITSVDLLIDSDFLGADDVTYLSPDLRGIEAPDDVSIDPGNLSRVLVDWAANDPGDYIRIITGIEPAVIPIPATGLLLVGGLGLMAMTRRRRKA